MTKKCATDFESDDNSLYAVPTWWDDEYKKCSKDDVYEWFTGSRDAGFIDRVIACLPASCPSPRIINLGCGISRIQDALYDAGYKDITNVDVSPTCIELMQKSDTRGMSWAVVDLMKTFPYDSESFDFALDKGTLDALIIDRADKWEIDDDVYETAAKYFREVSRCLRPGGVFVQITFGQPHFRRRLFERDEFHWTVQVEELAPTHSFHFYIYKCTKQT